MLYKIIKIYGCRTRLVCSRHMIPLKAFNLKVKQLPFHRTHGSNSATTATAISTANITAGTLAAGKPVWPYKYSCFISSDPTEKSATNNQQSAGNRTVNSFGRRNVFVCYTAPHVQCSLSNRHNNSSSSSSSSSSSNTTDYSYTGDMNDSTSYTHLWNLHVHSKKTQLYVSVPCDCRTAV
jgi:hypothetical protein